MPGPWTPRGPGPRRGRGRGRSREPAVRTRRESIVWNGSRTDGEQTHCFHTPSAAVIYDPEFSDRPGWPAQWAAPRTRVRFGQGTCPGPRQPRGHSLPSLMFLSPPLPSSRKSMKTCLLFKELPTDWDKVSPHLPPSARPASGSRSTPEPGGRRPGAARSSGPARPLRLEAAPPARPPRRSPTYAAGRGGRLARRPRTGSSGPPSGQLPAPPAAE